MLSGLMGGAGGGKDLKPPGTYKSREEVVETLKVAQPELVNPESMFHKLMIITQFYQMGVFQAADKKKFSRVARNTTLSLAGGFGLSMLGWSITNRFLQNVPRRSRVIGRSFISILGFVVPVILINNYNEKILTELQQEYTNRYIDFLWTNDMSKLSKTLAEEMKKTAPNQPGPKV